MLKPTVFTNFSANVTKKDVLKSLEYIFFPSRWRKIIKGKKRRLFENKLEEKLETESAFLFDSGRSSIYAALDALDIKEGDEVILPGYTCAVVVNAVLWAEAEPVFVDINENLNLDSKKLEDKVTENTKAILLQHTFGTPADIEKITDVAEKNDIKIIEDCAHVLGGTYDGKSLGNFGDVSIFSFGANKVISSIRGGAACTNNSDLADKLASYQNKLPETKLSLVMKYILYYPIFALGRFFYSVQIGKIILKAANSFNILPKIISDQEKRAEKPKWIPCKIPNMLADFGTGQLERLEEFNSHRREVAEIYSRTLPNKLQKDFSDRKVFFNFPIFVDKPKSLHRKAKRSGFELGLNWSGSNIVPEDVDKDKLSYSQGDCPEAEKISQRVLLLPTNINTSKEQAEKLADFLLNLVKKDV